MSLLYVTHFLIKDTCTLMIQNDLSVLQSSFPILCHIILTQNLDQKKSDNLFLRLPDFNFQYWFDYGVANIFAQLNL